MGERESGELGSFPVFVYTFILTLLSEFFGQGFLSSSFFPFCAPLSLSPWNGIQSFAELASWFEVYGDTLLFWDKRREAFFSFGKSTLASLTHSSSIQHA